jgi:glycosyltransferase involved in cell wall biosynthesis
MRWLYHLPDHFISVSHWVSEGIGKLGVPPDKRTIVYDGIALDKLELKADPLAFRNKYGVSEEDFAVGLVGLLIPWKGQNLFLDVAKLLRNNISNLVMMIVGGTPDECGDYERELRQRVIQEGLLDIVTFTGHVSDMCSVYNGLDVVVSASTSPEPLGTMVIECMAMGRPLIVPNHGGGSEMNTPGETALVFKAGDAESFALSISTLYQDSELRNRLGLEAREKALATFDVVTHARRVEQVYERVLKG